MLPFTKRPGKEDSDVVGKDDLVASSGPGSVPPPSSIKRSVPPPAGPPSSQPRGLAQSVSDTEEMTSIMQSRSMTGPILPGSFLPAAGRPPATIPPPSRRPAAGGPASIRPPPSSMRPPPSSQRGAQAHDEDADDDDNGRTVVRGAPKIVKRSNNSKGSLSPSQRAPNSISPAAVIKATMESARANNRRDGLMAGPPSDLLEDRDDFTDNMAPSQHQQRAPFVGRLDFTGPQLFDYEGPPSHRPPPMSMEGPPSYPPSSNNPFHGNTMQSHRGDNGPPSSRPGAYQPQSYGPPPNQQQGQQQQGQMSVPGVMPASMPAHFMTPQAPYAADPPGTAVTSGHRVAGRPAVSWAAALLAFGLFVGVAAVAVIQSSDSAADTTASFVDPARAPAKAAAPPAAAPVPVPVNANGVPVAAAPNGQGGLIGASPVQPQPPPDPNLGLAAAPVVATPGQPGIAFAPVPVAPAAKPHPHWRPAPPPPAAAPKAPTKPTTIAGSEPDEPKGPKKKPEKADDETKKALEQLQKAQLESAAGGAL